MSREQNWHITEETFPDGKINHKETVFSIGNGYFSTRGSFEEGFPGEIATTFVHGVFNDVPIFGTELVNFPNIFSMRVLLEDEVFALDSGNLMNYSRDLHMKNGLLTREVIWVSPNGRQATFRFERFANMAEIHHAALWFTISNMNFSGRIQVQFPVSGFVLNERYQHWSQMDQGLFGENACYITMKTLNTGISACISQKIDFDTQSPLLGRFWNTPGMPTLVYDFTVDPGEVISGVKHAMVYTNREVTDPVSEADSVKGLSAQDFDVLLAKSETVWMDLWSRSDVVIEGDDLVDNALRYNLFQVLIAAPRHDDTVSIGAKTLSGYGYRGHVFWDTEIFLLPFLIFTQPQIARNLLMYRYHTLNGARKKARENGFEGAMFAWESAATGDEVTPKWVTGPGGDLIRIWCGDIEQHITADIVYAIRQYWLATGDDPFLSDFGAEIIFEAAKFYASRLEWDPADGNYHIRNVIGPDEYHEHVDDNAMTNLMAQWVLTYAQEVYYWLKNYGSETLEMLKNLIKLDETEVEGWQSLADKIAIHIREDGIIEQFKGYFDLEYLDQSTLGERDRSLQSIYGVEGVQNYQFIKQPDVVMALHLIPERFSEGIVKRNFEFYTPRTDLSQGSSLGPSIQALMLARMGQVEDAREMLVHTLLTDLENNRGNTPDGIHAASAGAVWQVIMMGFLGLTFDEDLPTINPSLPMTWNRFWSNICWKSEIIGFDIK